MLVTDVKNMILNKFLNPFKPSNDDMNSKHFDLTTMLKNQESTRLTQTPQNVLFDTTINETKPAANNN
jgi:hypothetical protein